MSGSSSLAAFTGFVVLIAVFLHGTLPIADAIQGNPAPPNSSPCAATSCSYNLDVNGTIFDIKYVAAGPIANTNPDAIVLNEIKVDEENKSLLVSVNVAEAIPPARGNTSYLTIWLPRSLIAATNSTSDNAPFLAFDNDTRLEYHFGPTFFGVGHIWDREDVAEYGDDPANVRALSMELEPGNHDIRIIGTTIASEFGATSLILMAVGIIGSTVLVRRLQNRYKV